MDHQLEPMIFDWSMTNVTEGGVILFPSKCLAHDCQQNILREKKPKLPLEDPNRPGGPTARFPFLPAESEYGGPRVKYSVRHGGPKIYDLLGTLPMDQYGAHAQEILDKEEVILADDDLEDEHKVMHALWDRWIFLNRPMFVENHLDGGKKFIDDFWKIIRQAAGRNTLRYILLVLGSYGFFSAKEAGSLLQHYDQYCEE
ncbi:hypothetical protein C8R46DRAFT_1212450 [Mycena filopes]|nr:hypothetical protein C8R46DRAFT_1212450 [Mycena filopes]